MTKKIRVNLRKSVDKTKQSKKMNRRESLKNMTLSAFGLAAFPSGAIEAENIGDKKIKVPNGRLESEAVRDAKLNAEKFFTPDELKTVTVLSDIILPADATSGSASQVGVPAFIEFMMKDQPQYQTQMRGGLMWLNNQTNKRFQKPFIACSQTQQLQVVDDIAYPEQLKPGMQQGAAFFTLIRSFVMTGFYTTEVGFKDLGYVGNRPNNWEGVPEEVLKQYGVAYD
jgi:gluconate 2-dehydrogenase gamma chain